MEWREEYLDLIMVPCGLMVMFGYHFFLLYRCRKLPQTTVIGYENHCRRIWVERTLQVEAKDRGLSVTVISSTISAATFLGSTSLALGSLLGAWIGSYSHSAFTTSIIIGDKEPSIVSIKYISLLACFLLAFASFLQSVRSFAHAIFLISMPDSEVPVSYVQKAVIRGSAFWSIGLRVIYFAASLLMWFFGPIPMFVFSVVLVVVLYYFDSNSMPLNQFQPAGKGQHIPLGIQVL